MKLSRRSALFMTALAAACLTQTMPQAHAQAYPARQVKVIVPFAAGGPTDVMARLIAQKLSESLKQQFFVENHPGAGGNIGMTIVARANPTATPSWWRVRASWSIRAFMRKIPTTPSRISNRSRSPRLAEILVVNPELPVKTVKELVDLIKANPFKYPIANPGIGTTPQLAAELFKLALKLDATSVPFGGAAPAIQSTVANQTPIAFAAMPPVSPQVKGGKLRALAVTSAKRSPALPDVPTLAESGIKEQESETMQGVLVPAKTPKAIVDLLNAEIKKAMALPDVQAKCAQLGFDPVADTPEEFAAYIKKDVEKWGRVIKEANIPQIK